MNRAEVVTVVEYSVCRQYQYGTLNMAYLEGVLGGIEYCVSWTWTYDTLRY